VRFTVRRLMVVVAILGLAFGLLVWAYRVEMWTPMGPIVLILHDEPEFQAQGIGLALLLAPCILTAIVRPRPWSILIGVFAVLAWLFIGLIAQGINC
jgi:hypothetical protein